MAVGVDKPRGDNAVEKFRIRPVISWPCRIRDSRDQAIVVDGDPPVDQGRSGQGDDQGGSKRFHSDPEFPMSTGF